MYSMFNLPPNDQARNLIVLESSPHHLQPHLVCHQRRSIQSSKYLLNLTASIFEFRSVKGPVDAAVS